MPTYVHARLSRADMRDLIAWLRTVPRRVLTIRHEKRGPQFAAASTHEMHDAASQAGRLAPRAAANVGAEHARGRYLAQIACRECRAGVRALVRYAAPHILG